MQQSPIFSKTYDLIKWLIPTTTKFPREQRFVLAKHVQEAALTFQESIIEASMSHGRSRKQSLQKADINLTKLRFQLRLCQDLQLISPRQYRHAAEMVAEVGRLLGGWQKSNMA
ncbi:MAG: diversity-generating retroelement protein Avd [Chloroflexota bacterium]